MTSSLQILASPLNNQKGTRFSVVSQFDFLVLLYQAVYSDCQWHEPSPREQEDRIEKNLQCSLSYIPAASDKETETDPRPHENCHKPDESKDKQSHSTHGFVSLPETRVLHSSKLGQQFQQPSQPMHLPVSSAFHFAENIMPGRSGRRSSRDLSALQRSQSLSLGTLVPDGIPA